MFETNERRLKPEDGAECSFVLDYNESVVMGHVGRASVVV
jgi:hypothetical protein